jgi:hypothetical protein
MRAIRSSIISMVRFLHYLYVRTCIFFLEGDIYLELATIILLNSITLHKVTLLKIGLLIINELCSFQKK